VTDAVSSVIIRDVITPRFKAGDMGGGIAAGVDQLVQFMSLPAAEMQKRAAAIGDQEKQRASSGGSPGIVPIIFWIIIIMFVIMPIVRGVSGRRYGGRRGGVGPVILWGSGLGGLGGGGGSSWGGGGGGGFSGGGGSFGGGGSSGGW
jgi:uncharacterized protein